MSSSVSKQAFGHVWFWKNGLTENSIRFILDENSYTVSAETDVEFLTAEKDFFTVFRFKTTSPNEKKLLIIRDSFGTAMAEYIAVNYKRSVMIYDKAYTPAAIDEENADIVVYEVVERYLRNLLTCEVV